MRCATDLSLFVCSAGGGGLKGRHWGEVLGAVTCGAVRVGVEVEGVGRLRAF